MLGLDCALLQRFGPLFQRLKRVLFLLELLLALLQVVLARRALVASASGRAGQQNALVCERCCACISMESGGGAHRRARHTAGHTPVSSLHSAQQRMSTRTFSFGCLCVRHTRSDTTARTAHHIPTADSTARHTRDSPRSNCRTHCDIERKATQTAARLRLRVFDSANLYCVRAPRVCQVFQRRRTCSRTLRVFLVLEQQQQQPTSARERTPSNSIPHCGPTRQRAELRRRP